MRARVSFASGLASTLFVSTPLAFADPPPSESSAPPAGVVIGTASNESPPPPPPAEPPTWIELHGGVRVIGRVTGLRPGQFVEIEMLGGGSRVIAWSDIVRAGGTSFPNGYVAYGQPAAMAPPARPEPAVGEVPVAFVSVTNERMTVSPGFVLRGSGIGRAFTIEGAILCRTPCVGYAQPGPIVFTVQGRWGRQGTFHVDVAPTGNRVLIRPASSTLDPLSRVLYWGSPAVFLGGGALLIYGLMTGYGSLTPQSTPIIVGGAVVTATGFFSFAAGIAMYLANRPSLVSAAVGESPSRARWSGGIAPLADRGVMGSFGATF